MLPTEHASTAGLLGGYSRVRTGHSFRGRLNEKVGGRQAVWPKGCGEWRSQVVVSVRSGCGISAGVSIWPGEF